MCPPLICSITSEAAMVALQKGPAHLTYASYVQERTSCPTRETIPAMIRQASKTS
jgi:hypothetical protein